MNSQVLWYATRSTGLVSLVLLTLVVALGIAGSLRLSSNRWPRFVVAGLHRNLTLLALLFLSGHIATTLLDSYTPISVRDVFIPFLSSYRPIWLGLGAVAFDLLLALTVTSLLRARIGYQAWKALHWLAYAAWPVALVHGLGTGSDTRFGWAQLLTFGCVLIVLAAIAGRLRTVGGGARLAAAGAAAAATVLLVAWYTSGPGAKGWAARAGTPKTLLAAKAVQRVAAPVPTQTTADTIATPFTVRLSGNITQKTTASGLVRIDIRAHTTDGPLWIRLVGEPADGGVTMTSSGVAFGPRSSPNAYTGSITALEGTQLAASLNGPGGKQLTLDVVLSVAQLSHRVTGTVQGTSE